VTHSRSNTQTEKRAICQLGKHQIQNVHHKTNKHLMGCEAQQTWKCYSSPFFSVGDFWPTKYHKVGWI